LVAAHAPTTFLLPGMPYLLPLCSTACPTTYLTWFGSTWTCERASRATPAALALPPACHTTTTSALLPARAAAPGHLLHMLPAACPTLPLLDHLLDYLLPTYAPRITMRMAFCRASHFPAALCPTSDANMLRGSATGRDDDGQPRDSSPASPSGASCPHLAPSFLPT